jgi:hypothetical protein
MPKGPVPVAGKMLLQIAAQDIGQLTDLSSVEHPQGGQRVPIPG